MIRVPISEFLEIYLGAVLLWICAVWYLVNWLKGRREHRARMRVLACEICGHEFRDSTASPLSPCPACGRLNERSRPLGL